MLSLMILLLPSLTQAQVSTVKLKVSRSSKSDTKETYRSLDGRSASGEITKSICYKIELTNISSGPAKDFVVKWAVLVKSDREVWQNGQWKRGEMRVIQGEKECKLDFAKNTSFDTDVIEL